MCTAYNQRRIGPFWDKIFKITQVFLSKRLDTDTAQLFRIPIRPGHKALDSLHCTVHRHVQSFLGEGERTQPHSMSGTLEQQKTREKVMIFIWKSELDEESSPCLAGTVCPLRGTGRVPPASPRSFHSENPGSIFQLATRDNRIACIMFCWKYFKQLTVRITK